MKSITALLIYLFIFFFCFYSLIIKIMKIIVTIKVSCSKGVLLCFAIFFLLLKKLNKILMNLVFHKNMFSNCY